MLGKKRRQEAGGKESSSNLSIKIDGFRVPVVEQCSSQLVPAMCPWSPLISLGLLDAQVLLRLPKPSTLWAVYCVFHNIFLYKWSHPEIKYVTSNPSVGLHRNPLVEREMHTVPRLACRSLKKMRDSTSKSVRFPARGTKKLVRMKEPAAGFCVPCFSSGVFRLEVAWCGWTNIVTQRIWVSFMPPVHTEMKGWKNKCAISQNRKTEVISSEYFH